MCFASTLRMYAGASVSASSLTVDRLSAGSCKASLRAKVEHPSRVIKWQFSCTKVRYRGLAKNSAQVLTLFALSNLWIMRRQLLPAQG